MSDYYAIHQPCPACSGSDCLTINQDMSTYCHSCAKTGKHDADTEAARPLRADVVGIPKPALATLETLLATGEYRANPLRKITAETAQTYRVFYGPDKTTYGYFEPGNTIQPVAAKIRYPDKKFNIVGDWKKAGLFGQQLFTGGKYLTITEGEEDALAVYQMTGSKYPVVSIRNGASSAFADCKAAYEWLLSFETVVICFDADEPGKRAAAEVSELLGTKCKIMRHAGDMKDASDYLKAGKERLFTEKWWQSEQYAPDGIVPMENLFEALLTPVPEPTLKYPWQGLNRMLRGIREAELVTWCAGTGIGKSTLLREVVNHALQSTDIKVGLAFLEETPERTARGLAGLVMGKPIHLDGVHYTEEELRGAFDTLGTREGRVQLWDHFGSNKIDNVISRLKYFIKAMGCRLVILDHISIVISGSATVNERQTIDELMTRLRTEVVQETRCSVHVVSHLTRPDGKPLENGAPVTLSLLRGSGAIAQLSDAVIAAERDSQADSEVARNTVSLRVLKSRLVGKTGVACQLHYNEHTGRMVELGEDFT